MTLTTLNVAGIVSIILVFVLSACVSAAIVVAGGSTAYISTAHICSLVGLVLSFAFIMTGIVLRKLGFQRSLLHDISVLAVFASLIVETTSLVVASYQVHQYFFVVFGSLQSFLLTIVLLMECYRMFFAAPTSPVYMQDQEPRMWCGITGSGIWVAFGVVVGCLLLSILFEGVSPLHVAMCIILAMLAVSTWIVASTPMIGNGITEPLAPEEDSANTMRHGVEMA